MKNKFLCLFLAAIFLSVSNLSEAQRTYNKMKKISNGNGTLGINWGYNRSFYSSSDIQFKSRVYDFSLKGAKASDNQSKGVGNFLQLSKFTIPQYNLNVLYYFKDKYAINAGISKMKYVMNDANLVFIEGYVKDGVDSIFSGNYSNQEIVTNAKDFHYENEVNFFHFDLTRTEKLVQNRAKNFAICLNLGLGLGFALNSNDFNFEKKYSYNTKSLSGIGINASGSLRFEFFKNFFIQTEISGGSIQQTNVRTRYQDKDVFAKQQFWYGQRAISFGVLFYFKPVNGCNDCPNWN
jgi:hypothetical protein